MSGTADSITGGGRFLIVRSGAERFAIPATSVAGVHRELAVYPIPGGRAPLLGLAQQAGEALLVVDLLELVDGDVGGQQIIVVLRRGSTEGAESVGLAVDEAERIVTLAERAEAVDPAPGIVSETTVDGHAIRVVDPDLVKYAMPGGTAAEERRGDRA